MKKLFLTSGVMALAVVALFATTLDAQAADNRYAFIARGIITSIDRNAGTVELDVTKAVPAKAKDDLEGENKEFIVDDAKFYSYSNATKKDTRVTMGALKVGQEIGIKGVAKTDDTFELNFVRIHDRSFTIVGLLQAHDKDAQTLKLLVNSSNYKPTVYKNGTLINMSYPDDAKFYEKNTKTPVSFDFTNADAQKVQVKGAVEGTAWKVKTLIDHFK